MSALRDIESRDDLEVLVRAFYTSAFEDPVIGPVFTDVAQLDLEAHVPEITRFWETVLLGAGTYSGSVFNKHAALHTKVELTERHFDHWLRLWFGTVDERFTGEKANQAKIHALRVAQAFLQRLQGIPGGQAAA